MTDAVERVSSARILSTRGLMVRGVELEGLLDRTMLAWGDGPTEKEVQGRPRL
jgi:hypothetical protein